MARRGENIYKRKDGRWEGRYKTGTKPNGKSKYRSVYGRSYRAVKDKMILLRSQNKPEPVASGSVTVGELLDEWIEAVKNRVKPSTFANYQLKLERHIIPVFGEIRYEMLTPDLVQQFIQDKLQDGLSAK